MPRAAVAFQEPALPPSGEPGQEQSAPAVAKVDKRTTAFKRAKKKYESGDNQTGMARPRVMKSTGPARQSLEPEFIEPVDRPVDPEWAAMMAFSHELVTVRVGDSQEKNQEDPVPIWNNGECCRFPRNQEVTCERRFLEQLARAKMTTYSQQKFRDNDGNEHYKEIPHVALRYPFQVVEDQNPNGRDWIKHIQMEA